jgi:hypothetical protein
MCLTVFEEALFLVLTLQSVSAQHLVEVKDLGEEYETTVTHTREYERGSEYIKWSTEDGNVSDDREEEVIVENKGSVVLALDSTNVINGTRWTCTGEEAEPLYGKCSEGTEGCVPMLASKESRGHRGLQSSTEFFYVYATMLNVKAGQRSATEGIYPQPRLYIMWWRCGNERLVSSNEPEHFLHEF